MSMQLVAAAFRLKGTAQKVVNIIQDLRDEPFVREPFERTVPGLVQIRDRNWVDAS